MRRSLRDALAVAIVTTIAIALARVSGQQAEPFDLAATANGGRVEWISGQVVPVGTALNLIDVVGGEG